ncbi:unnamed protein product, partial [Closterium sp. NIES-53]
WLKRAAVWTFAGLGLALAVISCCEMADNYLVISHPSACVASSNRTHCAAEFRVARRSLSVVPQSQEQVTVAMVAGVQAQVAAIIAAADEIKASNVRNDHFTNAMARACARQANIALRYLGQAGDAIEAGTNQRDVPYWLAAADTQVDNCVDGFQTFSPSTEGLPAYVHLEYTAKKASRTLDALVSITNAAAKAAMAAAIDVPSTEEDVAPMRGRRMAVRSSSGAGSAGNGAMDWLEPGLYAQLQELQTRMNSAFAAGVGGEDSEGGFLARRQLDDDDDDDDDDEDKKDKEKKSKKDKDIGSDSGKKSSKKASPTAGPMYTAKKASRTLDALVSITNAAAKAAMAAAIDVPSTEEDVAPVRGRRMAVRSSSGAGSAGNGAMDWLEPGLYAQLQELQTRMNSAFAAGVGGEDSEGGFLARRQLDDDDDDDDDDEDKKDKEKKSKKDKDSGSDSGKKSSKKASPTAGPMVVSATLTASVTVGSGYSTIQAAVDAAPGGSRFVIYIPAGTYNEQVLIETADIVLIGAGADKTIITGDESYGSGSGTFESATVGVDSDRFVAFGIKFVNTAGPENHQAVAFRATGDQTALFDCAFDGAQDTLYVDAGRQYYKNCWIGGSMDFIFGDAAVVIDAPKIQLHPSPSFVTITASGRKSETPTGIVIRDAEIAADSGTTEVYLGRPWKKCAFTVFINANLPTVRFALLPALFTPTYPCTPVIEKDGWLSWNEGSCMFLAEAGSKGPGAASPRADWVEPGIITDVSGYDANTFSEVNSWLSWSG